VDVKTARSACDLVTDREAAYCYYRIMRMAVISVHEAYYVMQIYSFVLMKTTARCRVRRLRLDARFAEGSGLRQSD
jgi:hypothetical protein